jgi:hypothetical protein
MGRMGILNVGAGDIKLTFDKNNMAESIRAARVVADMLRRGFALMIEVDDGKGGKAYQRVTEFREDTQEYIIADLDPIEARYADEEEAHEKEQQSQATTQTPEGSGPAKKKPGRKPKIRERAVPAASTTGIAISRSAGG